MNSILLDTSFCIRLLKSDEPLHKNAVEYFQYFLENKIDMYLSTIVISEYSVKDNPNNLPLKALKIINFDFLDAKTSGEFYSILLERRDSMKDIDRTVVINDCKLIAQIYNKKIDAYITKDKKSFTKIIAPINEKFNLGFQSLDLEIPLNVFKNELPF